MIEQSSYQPKKSKNSGRNTWIPEPKTAQYYQELGLDYYEDPRETSNRINLQKCSYEFERNVKTVYRIRTNDRHEWLTWWEIRSGKTQLGSPIKPWMHYVGLNWKPVPTYTIEFDNETQTQTKKTSGMVGREREYAVEYSQENLDDLSQEINEFECQYILTHDDRDKFTVELTDFKTKDFDAFYKGMFRNRVEITKPR